MKNKEIQEKRMKEYFIQATRNILKSEGIKGISVRNIADQAGYSYATLYNYFKDVNDLVFLCVNDFQKECKEHTVNQTSKTSDGIDKLKKIVMAYIGYFIEYPGIFDLFYIAPIGDFGTKQSTIDVINNSLDEVCETQWNYCIAHNIYTSVQVGILKNQLKYTVVGLLLLYVNRRSPKSYSEFMNNASKEIEQLIKK